MIFFGTAKDLKFVCSNTRAWLDYLEKNDGKKIMIEVKLEKARRSLSQNDYLWGVVYKTIALETGHTENEVHEYLKRVCLPPRFTKIMGKEIKLPASTTELNKAEFGEYIEKIRAEVAPMGIAIPEANNKEEFDIPIAYPKNDKTITEF